MIPGAPDDEASAAVRIQAGDRGAVLSFDIPRQSIGETPTDLQATAATYFVPQRPLQGNELNGTWACSSKGIPTEILAVDGATATITRATGESESASLFYNAFTPESETPGEGEAAPDGLDGVAGLVPEEASFPTRLDIPMSSSLLVSLAVDLEASPPLMRTDLCHPSGD